MESDSTRHSRNNAEPRTIDLAAEDVKSVASAEAETAAEENRAEAETEAAASESAAEAAERTSSESPAVAPSESRSSAAPPRAQRSTGSLLASSFVVGVVVLAGAAGLQYWGVLPSMNSDTRLADSLNLVSSDVEQLKSSVSALEAAKPEVDLSPVNDKIAAIEAKLADVPAANGLSADADSRISALTNQISKLETALAEQKKAEDTTRAGLLMRIEALEKKAKEPGDDVEVAVAIASAGLKAAIDRGGPFAVELDTLAGVRPDDPAIAELKPFAATGVPARSKLVADFPVVADQILSAINSGDPNQSFTDRLISSAFSSIKVRPVGNVEGETPEAIVARMETRLTDGDLKGALAEWQKLPDTGKQVSSEYQKSLAARIRVEELVGSTLTRAVQGTESKG